MPDVILFPKFQYLNQDPPLSLESLAQHALSCGFDGVDALIREASWVKESDYAQSLPRFVRGLRAHGLKAYTASTDWGHEHADDIEEAYRLFADNGIRMFRFTMQTYQGPGTWRADLERCRKTLGKLEPLGQRYGVKALLQTHGGLLAFSPATALCLVDGLDPAALGIHYDPGNMLHQEGWTEPVKSVDIMGPYLSYVGVKNCGFFLGPEREADQEMRWRREWTRLEAGVIDWPGVLRALAGAGYDGPLCTHHFYEGSMEGLTEGTRADVAYLRRIMAEAWG